MDNDFDVELTGSDDLTPPACMIAVSNVFAHARKQMSLAEQKTFALALTKVRWTKGAEDQTPVVYLDKKILARILGYTSDSTDLSQNLWSAIHGLARHSYIEIAERDKQGGYESGMIITRITMEKKSPNVRIKFEDEYFPLFTGLNANYITLWSADIFGMTHKRSVQFYELLRQMSYAKYHVRKNIFSHVWGVKALKELLDIPKEGRGSYMRENGGFDRSNFEKRVLNPICRNLVKCRMIQLVVRPDGNFYEKVKKSTRVVGYRFYWTLSNRPAVADAGEVKEIADRVDKDPQILKITKDIINGKKRKGNQHDKGSFFHFEQRNYDYEELERQLLQIADDSLR